MFVIVCFPIVQRFNDSTEHLTNISAIIQRFFDKLLDESKRLEKHATTVDEIQTKSIAEFEKAYEVYLWNPMQNDVFPLSLMIEFVFFRSNQNQMQRSLLLMWLPWSPITCVVKKNWFVLFTLVIYICHFFLSLSQSLVYRWVQGLLILEKLFLEIGHSWMGMYPLWKVLQQMQKENGRTSICKQKARPKKMLISQLLNTAEWNHSCRSGKFLNLHLLCVKLLFYQVSPLIWICCPFSMISLFSLFPWFHIYYFASTFSVSNCVWLFFPV